MTNKKSPAKPHTRATTKAKVRPIADLWIEVYISVTDTLLAQAENDHTIELTAPDRARDITDKMLAVLEDRWPGMVV